MYVEKGRGSQATIYSKPSTTMTQTEYLQQIVREIQLYSSDEYEHTKVKKYQDSSVTLMTLSSEHFGLKEEREVRDSVGLCALHGAVRTHDCLIIGVRSGRSGNPSD